MIAKGVFRRSGSFGELHGSHGQSYRCRIGQHVTRVGKQRQAAGQYTADNLGEHITDYQDKSGEQASLAGIAQLMVVIIPAKAVMMAMVSTMAAMATTAIKNHTSNNRVWSGNTG